MSTNTTVVNQWIKRLPFAMILLAVALTLGLAFANLQPVVRFDSSAPEMDSATRSYIAWGEALKAANKEGIMVPVTGDSNVIDSATRSYIAWGEALKAANKEGIMVPVAGDSNAIDSPTYPDIAWAKACGVDLSYVSNVELDSATRSYISWAKSMQCGHIP